MFNNVRMQRFETMLSVAAVDLGKQWEGRTTADRCVCWVFREMLHELCCAAVATGARPHDVLNIVQEHATSVLGSELEWLTTDLSEVLSMIETERRRGC